MPRFTHRVDRYAEAVLDGGILAGPLVRLACQRHVRDRERAAAGGWYQFSEAHADQILDFFEGVLRLPDVVDETGEASPFRLDVGTQFWAFVLGSGFGWVDRAGRRRFREWYIEAGKGTAKALAVDTPIPTVDGWKAMGDIQPGDVLFDETGTRTTVVGAYDVMHGHECYRITFDDGSSIVADAEHLWVTEQRKHGTGDHGAAAMRGVPLSERGSWRMGVRTTAEIAATLRYKNGQHLSANHSIRLAGPLNTRQAFLPIEPYVLGVWLGDGDSDTARITVGAEDREAIVGALRATGTDCGPYQPTKLAYRVRIGGNGRKGPNPESMNARLRRAGLICNKHIPKAYLRSSADQRLALLQGLMDTDGTIDPRNGVCTFTSTTPALADGLFELVVSLGMKATRSERPARLNGRDVGTAHYVRFNAPDDLAPFRLERKARHHRRRHNRRRLSADRRIVACERVPSVPVRCIAVDSPSRLFLAGRSMVPTHNTPVLAGVGLYGLTMDGERAAEIYAAAADQDQASIMFRDAVRIAKASPDLDAELEYDGGAHIWQIRHPSSLSFFRTFSRESGQKSGTRPHMGLLDELHEHPSPETSVKVRAGAKRRPQPLFAEITNSGYDRTSICWQRHEHARRVLEGTVEDEALFAYVCALDNGSSEHVRQHRNAVQIMVNSCTCESVPITRVNALSQEVFARLVTKLGTDSRAEIDAQSTRVDQSDPPASAPCATTERDGRVLSTESGSLNTRNDGPRSTPSASPSTSAIGCQRGQDTDSKRLRNRNSEPTESTSQSLSGSSRPRVESAGVAVRNRASSSSITITSLEDLEDSSVSIATQESAFSEILSRAYKEHSPTCFVRQHSSIHQASIRIKYPADEPLTDPTCWPKTNPYIGVSVTEDYLRRQVENAKNIPAETNNVLRLNFCVWTQQHTRAIDMDQWRACKPMPAESELVAADCFGCLDLGETDDFTAWGRLWTLADGRVAVRMRYFIPRATLEKYPNRPYAQWQRAGLLTVTEGNVTDYDVVRAAIEDDCAAAGVQQVFYDPKTARETAQILMGRGLDMVPIAQGFALHEAITRLLALVSDGDLCHGGDEILAWMADNTVILTGARGEKRIDKQRAPEKIDGIAALVMGIDGGLVRRERVAPSYQMFFAGGGAS